MSSNATPPPPSGPVFFTLEFCTKGGPNLGQEVNEIDSCLKLNSRDHSAFLEKHRSQSDKAGEPIGTFRAQFPDEDFKKVADLVQREKLADLPAPTQGGPGASVLTLKFGQGQTKIDKMLTSRDINLIEQVDGLLFELNRLAALLDEHPLQAVKTELTYKGASLDEHFELSVTNIGSEPVCLFDPRLLKHDDADAWAGVRVAEFPQEKPGVTSPPLEWLRIGLERPLQQMRTGVQVKLAPGEKLMARTEAWRRGQRGVRHLAQGVLSNYSGPREVEGCYRIRGAVFSAALEVVPK
jgi:hypothetical protein